MTEVATCSDTAARDPEVRPHGARLPLNSRRLTAAYLRAIANALGLPTGGSGDQLRQCIEGHIQTELDRDTSNTLVIIHDVPRGETRIQLSDADGVFLDVDPIGTRTASPDLEATNVEALASLQRELEQAQNDAEVTLLELESAKATISTQEERITNLEVALKGEKEKSRQVWKLNCEYLADQDTLIISKDEEIARLKQQLAERQPPREGEGSMTPTPERASHAATTAMPPRGSAPSLPLSVPGVEAHESRRPESRRGKAPPVDPFTGEGAEVQLDDWLPALERAASWNGWSEGDQLLQLAGHLRGRALQEWDLLEQADKASYSRAVECLRLRLDSSSKTMAAQEFRHTMQKSGESVADFLRRLEKVFRVVYGRDKLGTETRDALLYGQLQEGLCYSLVQAPAVSGAQTYTELSTAARNEERRLAALERRQQHVQPPPRQSLPPPRTQRTTDAHSVAQESPVKTRAQAEVRKCYNCGRIGHLSRACRQPRSESTGRPQGGGANAKQIQAESSQHTTQPAYTPTPEDFLFSSSEDEAEVRMVTLRDSGSFPHCAKISLQGVPVYGILDSGADISIIGGTLFKRVAAAARLKKRDLKKADKIPRTYDQQAFKLDGRMDLDVGFNGKVMNTPIYIKMDAHDQLLLSEGVCRQLGIISYHSEVERWRGGRKQAPQVGPPLHSSALPPKPTPKCEAHVPMVRVRLVQTVNLLPHQGAVVQVQADLDSNSMKTLLVMEPAELDCGALIDPIVLRPAEEGAAHLIITNPTGLKCQLEQGTLIGEASPVEIVEPVPISNMSWTEDVVDVRQLPKEDGLGWRKKRLAELVGEPNLLSGAQRQQLLKCLEKHHMTFCLEDQERGETDLVELHIRTGDAVPKKLPVRRMPFVVRQEVARQLRKMQEVGVIQPSNSPWASPVVMVRKKDGTHRFCIDYRALNTVTKPDLFPLPRIDDLLDQLGNARFFSTLDLASGYWQIRVHQNSREKTAFITPQGLFEFQVMPFGLTNAPAVFQRLMQQVLAGLNPDEGPDFVVVYIDDILVFSQTLEDHLEHLERVMERLEAASLKLKPAKCRFARHEVEYLGHQVTPEGLKTNDRLVAAVQDFPQPQNIRDARRFLGMSSYYRRFIPQFANIAQPLHSLTRKGASFHWSSECQEAFDTLKHKLTTAPVLAYPSCEKPYTMETDASLSGLGVVLSQVQDDGKLHPVAYASRSLSKSERNYSVTELETLAVVWAVTHFCPYLYGQTVTVLTDHSAVKAVLGTPNPSGKHARWWTKVYGAGVREVNIVYRAGKLNQSADALSRSPAVDVVPEESGSKAVVAVVQAEEDQSDSISSLLREPAQEGLTPCSFAEEQSRDPELQEIIAFLKTRELPMEEKRARRIALQGSLFMLEEDTLYYVDPKLDHRRRIAVPSHLKQQILQENHASGMGGHFSGRRMYGALVRHWWWDGMYRDTVSFARQCPECAFVTGASKPHRPPLHPIPVSRPFQIVGVDIMELPKTENGNRYVIVLQDFLTKWPLVFPMPDQRTHRVARILVQEVIPLFGVPEALLSDRGTNLLSHLMQDLCVLLGIRKLNTTSHHPQCDGMVERFNRTLKTMLRKHASKFGMQWDQYLHGALWAYRNVPHEATGEKPSFLLLGVDCRTPTEAALLPPQALEPVAVEDYREEVVLCKRVGC